MSDQKYCRHCKNYINKEAKVCYHCSRSQNRFWSFIERVSLIIVISAVALSWLQFNEARKERVKAEEAFSRAEKAKNKALEATQKTKELKQETSKLKDDLKENILSTIKMVYLQAKTRAQFGTSVQKNAEKEIEKELNKILIIAIPDKNERAQWINEMNQIISPKNNP
jgi:RNA polymerase subunit RPABC4/transcription elongation factor Spt4